MLVLWNKTSFRCLLLVAQLAMALPAKAIEADIPAGAIVEGSSKFQGLQPDYLVDFKAQEFDQLRHFSKEIAKKNIPIWEKVNAITQFIRKQLLPRGAYNDPEYLLLMKKYLAADAMVPLSAYVSCGAGVCRENAMIVHLALKEAGIENKFVYAKVQQTVFELGKKVSETIEDHAFNVVTIEGKKWIVDSYNENFHGFSYDQLLESNLNSQSRLKTLPGAVKNELIFRRIVHVNNFPKVIQYQSSPCEQAFRSLKGSGLDRKSD